MPKRKTIIWIVVVLLAVAGVFSFFKSRKPKIPDTAAVTRGKLVKTVLASGTVVSKDEIDLSFKTGGKIIAMSVEEGYKVSKGEKIAQLDKGTLPAQISQAQASIRFQKETLDNMKLYKNQDTFSKDQKDAQRANIDNANAALAALQEQLSEMALFSPQDGIVLKKNFDEGETIPANAALISLSDTADLEIEAKVPEAAANEVQIGQVAEASFDAIPGEKIEMSVTEIEPDTTVVQGNNYYLAKLQLVQQDSRVKKGMSPDVNIRTSEKNNVLLVPISAIKNEGDQKYIELWDDLEEKSHRENIRTGIQGDNGMVEIISGVKEGDRVLL
ncbi:MAG TPA: efflux RND transporter periplasmic adaptor subunit [Candidatus Bathyarchaeia archaeon]|nr:efflux RND transporter periplasmic adaptor subunit [Candidatus Bathyarchaeia archaeon]